LIALIINTHPDVRVQMSDDGTFRHPLSDLRHPIGTIRKTSLLHKIEPTALRSSAADISGIRHQRSGYQNVVLIPYSLIADP